MKQVSKDALLEVLRSKEGPYDGHTHTTISDGVLPLAGLVKLAAEQGISHLAITDHDFPLHPRKARILSLRYGIDVIPGVELNVVHRVGRHDVLIHLGLLWLPEDDEGLNALLAHNQNLPMKQYAMAMLQKLFVLGLDPSGQGVEASLALLLRRNPGCKYLGKGHVSQLLADTGLVSSRAEAGHLYLGEHGERRAYVAKEDIFDYIRMEQVLKVISRLNRQRKTATVVTLNHPFHYRLGEDLPILIDDFDRLGGHAIEVYYPKHTPERVQFLQGQCRAHGLLENIGSDYHYDAHQLVAGDPNLFRRLRQVHRKEWKPNEKAWW